MAVPPDLRGERRPSTSRMSWVLLRAHPSWCIRARRGVPALSICMPGWWLTIRPRSSPPVGASANLRWIRESRPPSRHCLRRRRLRVRPSWPPPGTPGRRTVTTLRSFRVATPPSRLTIRRTSPTSPVRAVPRCSRRDRLRPRRCGTRDLGPAPAEGAYRPTSPNRCGSPVPEWALPPQHRSAAPSEGPAVGRFPMSPPWQIPAMDSSTSGRAHGG